jgi:hypothetical protein
MSGLVIVASLSLVEITGHVHERGDGQRAR